MSSHLSSSEAAIHLRLGQVEPGSQRHQLLCAARDFKAAWVQLGRYLTQIRDNEQYKEWGYHSFESYCKNELHIRSDTANKLTRSFSFLREKAPTTTQNHAHVPALDVVDMLAQMPTRSKLSANDIERISNDVLESDSAFSKQHLLKRVRELDPEAFKKQPAKNESAMSIAESPLETRKALLLAERLLALVEPHSGDVPSESVVGLKRLVLHLQNVVEPSQAGAA